MRPAASRQTSARSSLTAARPLAIAPAPTSRRAVGLAGAALVLVSTAAAAHSLGACGPAVAAAQPQRAGGAPAAPPAPAARARGAPGAAPPPGSSMGTVSKIVGGVRSSQAELVDHLIRNKLVKTQRVADAMRGVDRAAYVNPSLATRADAYADHPLAIGEGQTISAPHMHAICLELLERHLVPGARVLDVGSGAPRPAAPRPAPPRPAAPRAHAAPPARPAPRAPQAPATSPPAWRASCRQAAACWAWTRCPSSSCARARRSAPPTRSCSRRRRRRAGGGGGPELLRIVHGNALSDLLLAEAPFNAIHVGAAADELHQVLLDRLAPGGRMVIPVGPHYSYQVLMAVDKDAEGHVTSEALMDVGYVPLTRPSDYEDGALP
ncbi:pcmt [Scenedesmus sp. PABB004]|nr:pcmt [Scenedesmus sp. PABB004]